MPVTTDVESGPFSATLRASTLPAHERANHSEYMNALLGGELTRDGYTRLAIQYYFIYQAIEQAADKLAKDPVAGKFVFEELRRLPSLERDLAHLVGPGWRDTIRPLPSTERYARRVAEASDWSGGFVAHHYTRYLGDIAAWPGHPAAAGAQVRAHRSGFAVLPLRPAGQRAQVPGQLPRAAERGTVDRGRARAADRGGHRGLRVQHRGVRRAGERAGRVPGRLTSALPMS